MTWRRPYRAAARTASTSATIASEQISVSSTLPSDTQRLITAALLAIDEDLRHVALRVKRHGVRRAWFAGCCEPACPLPQNTDADYQEGAAAGPGHLFGRRGDLAPCTSSAGPVITVDRTRHWVTGRAYDGVPFPRAVPRDTRYVVTLKVPGQVPAGLLPAERSYHRAKTAGPTWIATPDDDIVFVLAHELAHITQYRERLPRSEVQAELAGREGLRRWVDAGRPGEREACR